MSSKRFIFSAALVMALTLKLNGQIVAWDFLGAVGNEATINATSGSLASTISRGAGISGSALANAFNSSGFGTGSTTLANAISENDYLTFSITPTAGYSLSLTTIDAVFRRSGTGPSNFQWQYSLDGFATAGTNIGSAISFSSTATDGVAQTQISLSSITAMQSITGTVTFRLYGWGATNAGGVFGLGRLSGNDLAIGGSLTAIPEPSTYAAIVGVLALGGVMWQRRRKAKQAS